MSWTDDEDLCALVIDNGSSSIKAGTAGDDNPKVVLPSMVGYPANNNYYKDQQSKAILSAKYAIKHGIITSIEDMEAIWYHIFYNELNVNPSERPILLIDTLLNPKSNRELIIQSMFETFDCPATYIMNQGILALYASGRTTGITLGIGGGVTQCVPIWEGYCIPCGVRRRNFSGAEITNYLIELLRIKGHIFSTSMEREIVRDLKEKECFVAIDYEQEIDEWESSVGTKGIDKKYKLPDGEIINVNMERFKSAELLFKPELIDIDSVGIHELLYKSIKACDMDTRRDLYSNIVMFGCTTLLSGFGDRMQKEMKGLTQNCKIKIVEPPERSVSAWIGGSIVASLSTFEQKWISQSEYDEYGANIVNRKCHI